MMLTILFPPYFSHVEWLDGVVLIARVTTCLENLEMSGNLKHVREMSGMLLTVREMSGKKILSWKSVQCIATYIHSDFVLRNH